MGFSVRLAPGVRVRASSRGLRTSIGPRAARLHVGAGRPGFSTGAGPVGYYTSLGGSSRRTTRPSQSATAAQRRLTAADKAEQAREMLAALEVIQNVHREEFPSATPPVAKPPSAMDPAQIHTRHRKAALKGIGIFQRQQRTEAKQQAFRAAEDEIAALTASATQAHRDAQAGLDNIWKQLLANDPEVVLGVLAGAFEDNEAAAAPVGVTDSEAAVVVLVPAEATLPERMPSITDAGNLSLRKLTKTQRSDLYKVLVCGHALVTVKEALAVAPGLAAVRIIALRDSGVDSYGKRRAEAVLAARFTRKRMQGIRWAHAASPDIVNDAADELLIKQQGSAKAFAALDLANEPEINALIAAVDLDNMSSPA